MLLQHLRWSSLGMMMLRSNFVSEKQKKLYSTIASTGWVKKHNEKKRQNDVHRPNIREICRGKSNSLTMNVVTVIVPIVSK